MSKWQWVKIYDLSAYQHRVCQWFRVGNLLTALILELFTFCSLKIKSWIFSSWFQAKESKNELEKNNREASKSRKHRNMLWKHVTYWMRVLRPRPYYVGRIWKRRFPFENTSNVFRPPYAGEIRWKRATIAVHFEFFFFLGKRVQVNDALFWWRNHFRKAPFQDVLRPHENAKRRL